MNDKETDANTSGTIEHTEKFLDTMFIEGIVKNCFEDLTRNFIEKIHSDIGKMIQKQKDSFSEKNVQANTDARLISKLESEIVFLRDEMKNKNKIIDILLSDKNPTHNTHNTQSSTYQTEKIPSNLERRFEFPKRHARPLQNQLTDRNNYVHDNQFNALLNFDETFNDDNKNDESKDTENEPNIQQRKNRNFDNITDRRKPKTTKQKSDERKRYVAVVGDSIVKEVKGHLLSTRKETVVVKTFSGATTKQMFDYVKPTLEMKPDQLLIHVGTNDLKKSENNEDIAENIVSLALHCHNSSQIPVVVSSLTYRDDKFKDRIGSINEELKIRCEERNIGYIDNSNIQKFHLNRSKLHLNAKGSTLLAKNFKIVTSN